ncbi:TPA: hypothetical protein ACYLN4_000700 [Burkholderia lata]
MNQQEYRKVPEAQVDLNRMRLDVPGTGYLCFDGTPVIATEIYCDGRLRVVGTDIGESFSYDVKSDEWSFRCGETKHTDFDFEHCLEVRLVPGKSEDGCDDSWMLSEEALRSTTWAELLLATSAEEGKQELSASGREYLFHIEGLGREVWQAGVSEKTAHNAVWAGLSHEERDRVVQMECIDEREVAKSQLPEMPQIAWEDVDGELHVAKVDGVRIGSVEGGMFSDDYAVCLYLSAASMGSEKADSDEVPTLEAGKARLRAMVETALANRTSSAVLAVIEGTPAGADAPDNLGWLYGEAHELRKVKTEMNGDYSPEDLEAWDDRLAVAEMTVSLLKDCHPSFYQQLQQRARNLVALNRESFDVKERERDAHSAGLAL